MAAVLCGGISKCIGACCDCVGHICTFPFRICGVCCEGCCKLVTNCCTSSFCFYITVTVSLNLPPILLGIMDMGNVVEGCQASLWLLIFWLLCAIHILAAFYMARAVDQDDSILPVKDEQQNGRISSFNASSGAGRMKNLFCYDFWMAGYILVVCGYFVWLLLGAGLFVTEDEDNSECDGTVGTMGIAYGFGWAFVFMGGCSLCCSLCCGLFSGSNNPGTHFVSTSQQQQQQSSYGTTSGAPSATATATSAKPGKSQSPPPPSAPAEAEIPVASAVPYW